MITCDRAPGIIIKLVELAVMDLLLVNSFKGLIKMNLRAGVAPNSVNNDLFVSLAIYNYKKEFQ